MQAMKVEKDNLMDRCDACEQSCCDAKMRREKTEEEVNELQNKSKTLEAELDIFTEKLAVSEMKQKEKEAQVMAAEAEFNRLNRRVQELEEDLETTETKFVLASQKMAEDADKKYDETQKKMADCERALEVSDERASTGEFKIIELEEELKVVANNLKSLEVSEDKANQRETFYKDEIKRLTAKLKQSETRAEFAERSVGKLQKEVDRLEDELLGEQDKFKAITEELDQTFAEMSGY